MAIEVGGIHIEEVSDGDDLIGRMNDLDPPVTREEEQRVRKKDLRLPPFLLILYMFTWLDRGNLSK
jgi:hypothetical protein